MTTPVNRCPYCTERENFKVMQAVANGDWYKCAQCGHVIIPSDPSYECVCQNCRQRARSIPVVS